MSHVPPNVPPEPESDGISLIGILGTLRRRWVPMLLFGLPVAFVFAAVAWSVIPAPYRAYATLRVAAREPRLVFQTNESSSLGEFDTYRKTQVALIRSRFVLNAALRNPEIASMSIVADRDEPIGWLERQLVVDTPNSPEILRIALDGDEPTELAALVNSVRDAYLDEVVNVERQQRRAKLSELERIYAETEEKVRLKEERVVELARTLGSGDSRALTTRQLMALEYFGQLQREHSRVRFELMQEQVRRRALGPDAERLSAPRTNVVPGVRDGQVVRRAQLRGLIARFERQVNDPEHPSLVEYRRELESLESRIGLPTDDDGQPIVEDALAMLERQEAALAEEIDQYAALVDEIGTGSVEMETMQSDIDQVARIAERVGTEMETLRIELQSPPRVKPLEEAEVPTTRETGKQVKLTLAAAVAGFGAVAALFVLLDMQSDRVSDAGEMGERTGIPVLGSLPGGSADERREALDSARNLLLHRAERTGQRILLVTGPTAEESHAALACDLAASLARSGRSTVLVDLDFRTPIAGEWFDLPATTGAAEAIDGRATLATVVQWTDRRELAVVTVGNPTDETTTTLTRSGPRELLERLREMFDFVVVNAGPLLTDAGATTVARGVDGALLAIRRDVSQMPRVQEASGRLRALDVPVLGAIVVGAGAESATRSQPRAVERVPAGAVT